MEQLERIGLFSAEDLPKAAGKAYLMPADVPSRKWSMNSRFLTVAAGRTADAVGFRQWQAGTALRVGISEGIDVFVEPDRRLWEQIRMTDGSKYAI